MENEPIRDPRLWEAMESCRPGHDDLADPEMAWLARELEASPELVGLHRRLQRLDAAMADAFRDVPVPPGLEARILARLEEVSSEVPSSQPEVVPATSLPAGLPGAGAARPLPWRRRWLLAGGGLATAAVVLLVLLGSLPKPTRLAKSEVLHDAIQFYLSDTHEGGHPLAEAAPEYPFSQSLASVVSRRVSEIRWRSLEGFLNRTAVAFDVVGPQGIAATLYVTDCSADELPSEVPLRPMLSTGETSVSVWQEGGLLYVLVVEGGIPAYERFCAASAGPVA